MKPSDEIRTTDTVRPPRYAGRDGIICSVRRFKSGTEYGVDLSSAEALGELSNDAWFREQEITARTTSGRLTGAQRRSRERKAARSPQRVSEAPASPQEDSGL